MKKSSPLPDVSHQTTCNLQEWAGLRSRLLFLYDQEIPAGTADRHGVREDGEFSAWLIRRGWVEVIADGKAYRAEAGQWLICFAKEITQTFSEDVHLLSLRVEQAWPDGSLLFQDPPGYVFTSKVYPELENRMAPLYRQVINMSWLDPAEDFRGVFLQDSKFDYLGYLDFQVHLMGWIGELARILVLEKGKLYIPDRSDPRLAEVFEVIHSCKLAEPFPEAAVCRAASLTIGHLNRLCVQRYGFTVHALWEKQRIQYAKRALERPGSRVKEVASLLGFVQLSNFSAWFKRKGGVSPRSFQKQMLNH